MYDLGGGTLCETADARLPSEYVRWVTDIVPRLKALPVSYLNRIGKMCVAAGLIVGFLAWFVLVLIHANNPLASGISSLIGMAATSVADIVYRVLNHRNKGVVRLVYSDYGGNYLSIPVWCIGLMLFIAFGYWLLFKH